MSGFGASALTVGCLLGSVALAAGCNDPAASGAIETHRHDLYTAGLYVPDSEADTLGRIHAGSYLDTQVQDGTYETLKEGPEVGIKRLDHRWAIETVPGAATYQLKIVAKKAESGGDAFLFTYATAAAGTAGPDCAGPWSAVGGGCSAGINNTTCTGNVALAGAGSWKVCIKVEDSDTTDTHKEMVKVDVISLRNLCGDGVVQPGEDCDGAGSTTDCCTDTCRFVPSGSTCGDGVCELCNATGGCVPTAAGPGPGCNAAATACSGADACDGAGACNTNDLAAGAEGECGACSDCDGSGNCAPVTAGSQDIGCNGGDTACSGTDACDGAGHCERNDLPAGAEGGCGTCRDCDGAGDCAPVSAGEQDVGCDGTATTECEVTAFCSGSGTCLGGGFAPAGTVCRAAVGACDHAETCSGSSGTCPADTFTPAGSNCRPPASVCDAPELCTGTSPDCPADAPAAVGTICRVAVGACDRAESCDGSSFSCPADQMKATGEICRKPNGECDSPEVCDGASSTCPADLLMREGTTCRERRGDCDATETCDGSSPRCPVDHAEPDGTSCRYNGVCTYGACVVP